MKLFFCCDEQISFKLDSVYLLSFFFFVFYGNGLKVGNKSVIGLWFIWMDVFSVVLLPRRTPHGVDVVVLFVFLNKKEKEKKKKRKANKAAK